MLIIGLHISLHNVYKTLKNARFCSKTGLTNAVDIKKRKTLVSYSPTRV